MTPKKYLEWHKWHVHTHGIGIGGSDKSDGMSSSHLALRRVSEAEVDREVDKIGDNMFEVEQVGGLSCTLHKVLIGEPALVEPLAITGEGKLRGQAKEGILSHQLKNNRYMKIKRSIYGGNSGNDKVGESRIIESL